MNRRTYFEDQIDALSKKIEHFKLKSAEIEKERSERMKILSTSGALDQHALLIRAYQDKLSELQRRERCLEMLREAEKAKEKIQDEEKELVKEAATAYQKLEETKNAAKNYFAQLIKVLYEKPGELNLQLIEEGNRLGFSFWSKIPCDDSSGIKKMRIFAFDMTMLHQQRICNRGIDFLVHDSSIFDTTDPRQIAHGLKAAKTYCENNGCQYICMMNFNDLSFDEVDPIITEDEITKATAIELSDDKPENCLLGMRFD